MDAGREEIDGIAREPLLAAASRARRARSDTCGRSPCSPRWQRDYRRSIAARGGAGDRRRARHSSATAGSSRQVSIGPARGDDALVAGRGRTTSSASSRTSSSSQPSTIMRQRAASVARRRQGRPRARIAAGEVAAARRRCRRVPTRRSSSSAPRHVGSQIWRRRNKLGHLRSDSSGSSVAGEARRLCHDRARARDARCRFRGLSSP